MATVRNDSVTFTASQFTPTQWDSADDKAWFANHFVTFVTRGFEQKHFSNRFYRRLSNTFGHIAHYNRHGFWQTFFTTTEDTLPFLEITLNHPCYGDPEWTYSDVERALKSWLADEGTLEVFRQKLAVENAASERAQYERLRVKFQ